MSRLGKKPVAVPSGVKALIEAGNIRVEGPKGKLALSIPKGIVISLDNNNLSFKRPDDTADMKARHGLAYALVNNMVKGVSEGFSKTLEIKGVGYRAQVKGKALGLTLGFSHPVDFPLPDGVTAKVDGNTKVTLESADKALLGDVAAKIRALRPPEPYQGKGIKYSDEVIRRKAGKSASSK
jgi:large subunit ribosomal protein L6